MEEKREKNENRKEMARKGTNHAGLGNILVEYFALPAGKDFGFDKRHGAFRPARASNTDRNVTMKQPLAAADYFTKRSGSGNVFRTQHDISPFYLLL